MLRITLAVLHLIALGIGLGAVIDRGSALREPASAASLRRAFRADAMWGIAAGLWLATGLWRWFGAMEKSADYYLRNHIFLTKMALFAIIFALEMWPMITLMRWRRALAKGGTPESVCDPAVSRRIATISHVQAMLVVLMVIAATAMARGYGARP